jgi:hypothetical protein
MFDLDNLKSTFFEKSIGSCPRTQEAGKETLNVPSTDGVFSLVAIKFSGYYNTRVTIIISV